MLFSHSQNNVMFFILMLGSFYWRTHTHGPWNYGFKIQDWTVFAGILFGREKYIVLLCSDEGSVEKCLKQRCSARETVRPCCQPWASSLSVEMFLSATVSSAEYRFLSLPYMVILICLDMLEHYSSVCNRLRCRSFEEKGLWSLFFRLLFDTCSLLSLVKLFNCFH